MATNSDFAVFYREDCTLTVSMAPPTAIGGWNLEFRMQRYFGETQSGSLLKSVASGFSGASGITITNSGQGILSIDLQSVNTSGLAFGNYSYDVRRTDAGQNTIISLGYCLLGPDIG